MEKKYIIRKKYIILLFTLFIVSSSLMFIIAFKIRNKNINERHQCLDSINIEFTGTVISKKEITRDHRPKIIICVDLSYSNTQYYSILNEKHYIFCKIDNGIASFVIPRIYERVDSVSVNMNNDRLQRYYYKGELLTEYPLSFSYSYLTIEDLQWCSYLE